VDAENVTIEQVQHRVYKFRLYPSRAQETAMNATLDILRGVYNSLLHEREFLYQTTGKGIGQFAQEKHFTVWKKDHPDLKEVHAHLLQTVALRVNLAFNAFFRRVRENAKKPPHEREPVGYPRPKGKGQYDSFTFKQWGVGVQFKSGNLSVSKIGPIKGRFHREMAGTPKTATIKRDGSKWYVSITCEVPPEPLEHSEEAVGIDVGLKVFAALSNGEFIENPRFFRRDEKALAKAQRKFDRVKHKHRTKARRKAKKVVARIHERIRNRRHDFVHQTARRLVNRFGVIAVEALSVESMMATPAPKPNPDNAGQYLPNGASQKAGLNKSIADVSWSMFRSILTAKAESACREVYAVDPRFTSQDCHVCGYRPDGKEGRTKKTLKDRWHLCPLCGASVDRDTNAAINILNKATNRIGDTMRGMKEALEAPAL
jgi:putative transposase